MVVYHNDLQVSGRIMLAADRLQAAGDPFLLVSCRDDHRDTYRMLQFLTGRAIIRYTPPMDPIIQNEQRIPRKQQAGNKGHEGMHGMKM
jgi:hypothetical protein